jgi:hypothetical protein
MTKKEAIEKLVEVCRARDEACEEYNAAGPDSDIPTRHMTNSEGAGMTWLEKRKTSKRISIILTRWNDTTLVFLDDVRPPLRPPRVRRAAMGERQQGPTGARHRATGARR